MEVDLEDAADGVLVPVQARPGARRNAVAGVHAGRLKVAVTQAPERGKANEALVELLAAALGVKRQQVQLASGPTASQKKFRITGLTREQVRERIAAALAAIE